MAGLLDGGLIQNVASDGVLTFTGHPGALVTMAVIIGWLAIWLFNCLWNIAE